MNNRISRVVLVTAVAVAMSAVARAQTRPDFSGSWVYAEEKSKMSEGFSLTLSFPSELAIKQSGNRLEMVGTSNHLQPIVSTYNLEGIESTFDTAAGRVKARVAWQGNKLVIAATRTYGSPIGEVTVNTTDVYSLDGDVLTVDRTQETAGLSKGTGITVYVRSKARADADNVQCRYLQRVECGHGSDRE